MRILQVLPRVPIPQNDGGAQAMFQLTQGLLSRGHEVHWAALNTRKHWVEPKDLPTAWPIHTLAIDTEPTAVAALGALFFQRTPYHVLRFLDERFSRLLEQTVRQTAFDAVMLETAFLLPYVWVLRHATHAPIVLRSHNLEHAIWRLQARAETNPIKKLYWRLTASRGRRWEARATAEVDGIAAISGADAAAHQHLTPRVPVAVVRPGVAALPELVRPGEGRRTVGYLGALDWQPNLLGLQWFLTEVWPQIRQQVPGAVFHLAGKRPSAEVYRWAQKDVILHGEVPDAAAFWDSLDVAVVPVTVGGGVRLKVLEALSRGVPMVTTPTGALGAEDLEGDGFVLAGSSSDFAAAVATLLLEPGKALEAGMSARQRVSKYFDFQSQLAALEALFQQVQPTTRPRE